MGNNLFFFTNASGNTSNDANAGTFYFNANNDTSNSNSNIGTHLKCF